MSQFVRQWQVPSSKPPKTYIVSISRTGEWSCACKGWTTHMPRRACAHIKLAKETGDQYLLWSDAVSKAPVQQSRKADQPLLHYLDGKRAISFDD